MSEEIITLLRCFTEDCPYHWMWFGGSIAFIVFFSVLFFYGLIPIIKYRLEFWSLSTLNRSSRICFIFAILLKLVLHPLTFIDWKDHRTRRILGFIIYSLPSYFITTCYTLVLISWITICMQILPLKIVKIFVKAKVSLIIYNVIIYGLYISGLVFECLKQPGKLLKCSGYFEIFRDIILALIYIAFIVLLERGLKDDSFAETNIEQKKLLRLVIFLSIMLLTRGAISVAQVAMHNTSICKIPFFSAVCFSEMCVEGIPLFVLLRINNGFLGTKRKMSFDLGTHSLIEG